MPTEPTEDYAGPSESHPHDGRSATANNGGDPNLDESGEMGIKVVESDDA